MRGAVDDIPVDAISYVTGLEVEMVRTISDSVWKVAQRKLREEITRLIRDEMDRCAATSYGKGQRVMANRIIDKMLRADHERKEMR